MIDKAQISNPKTHYGSGKGATRLFRAQRLTGLLNFFAWFVVRLAGADRSQMVEMVRNPFVAVVLVLLLLNVCAHMRIGMREVIEDYIDEEASNRLALRANDAFAAFVAVIGIVSILKILIWG
jgi:succinate dehydrogenase / fumarate reductase membrane anchor subunit